MIATSIEQSKRLLELGIKAETADMWWNCYSITYDIGHAVEVKVEPWLGNFNWFNREDNIPAWSLSALLELMPTLRKEIMFTNVYATPIIGKTDYPEKDIYECFYSGSDAFGYIKRCYSKCPIDAAVEMIEWLITNKCIKYELHSS